MPVSLSNRLRAAWDGVHPRRMRTVTGPTDHVVVVGAGLAGLSAAMRLVGAGRQVTVLERETVPGGRAGVLEMPGPTGTYRFDTGPTVLTMPDLIADCFDCLGEDLDQWVTLEPVNPLYKARFADSSELAIFSDTQRTADHIADFAGGAEAAGYLRYVDYVSRLYRYEMTDFIDRNIDSPTDLLTINLARLIGMGAFGRLSTVVEKYLRDDRVRRLFSFQSLYAGVAPQEALAIYAVIAYMDSVAGVFFPQGGMHTIPQAMAAAVEKHGGSIRYGQAVAHVEHFDGHASAVITAEGERIPCDAVVLSPDLPVARRDLLDDPVRRRLQYSPSCWLMLAGSTTAYPDMAHHTMSFGTAWEEVFAELTGGRLMSDPSILISTPTVSDPSLAPPGRHSYYVLFPTPNTSAGIDWGAVAAPYREHVLATLERRGFTGFADGLEVEHVTTPVEWAAQGMAAGTPFASAHVFSQTGPFRPSNLWGENVVFTGSGTIPGVGVPMVLISGRLAAERITGADPTYRSRALR